MGRGLLAIIILAIAALLLTLFAPWGAGPKAAELEDNIRSAYDANGIPANVEMRGNVAHIMGEMPDAVVKQQAVELAEAARCETCEDKKWHEVSDETTVKVVEAPVIPTQSPYTLTAVLGEDGQVVLDGYVPSDEAKASVLARAEQDFPGRVTNDVLRVAQGAPTGWTDAVMLNLDELEHLETGRLTMNDTDVLLVGRAANLEERAAIRELAENEPAGFNQVLNIEVIGEDADNVGQLDNDALCQELLNELNNENAVQFAVDSARLNPGRPIQVLGSLAGGMEQCPNFKVKVEGHTSTPGDNAYNLDLSQRRAQTVVTYLSDERGISEDRLSSEGFGETRLKVSPEVTEEDRAANRRIEFIVSR